METTLLFFVLVVLALSVVVGVGMALIFRRLLARPGQTDVDELAVIVERLAKAHRKERMSRVRQAADDPAAPPPELVSPPEGLPGQAVSMAERKAAIRKRLGR